MARRVAADPERVAAAIGIPVERWAHQCHAISLAIVKAGLLGPEARVARGWAKGVAGQHSWIVLGNPYDREAVIVDPTLWSYVNRNPSLADVPTIYVAQRKRSIWEHTPHGEGSIFEYGRPSWGGGQVIELAPEAAARLTPHGQRWLAMIGPLDRAGWMEVAHAPVSGWPAAEVISAMYDTPQLSSLVPVDIVGMLTDRNPSGLYLAEREPGTHHDWCQDAHHDPRDSSCWMPERVQA